MNRSTDTAMTGLWSTPLVECVDLKDVRNKHFVASSIKATDPCIVHLISSKPQGSDGTSGSYTRLSGDAPRKQHDGFTTKPTAYTFLPKPELYSCAATGSFSIPNFMAGVLTDRVVNNALARVS